MGTQQWALQGYSYTHIGANGTFTIITALAQANQTPANPAGCQGLYAGVALNSPGSSWTLTVYDGTAAQNIVIAIITSSSATPVSNFPLQLKNGLTVVASGTTPGSATVAWI